MANTKGGAGGSRWVCIDHREGGRGAWACTACAAADDGEPMRVVYRIDPNGVGYLPARAGGAN